MRTFSALLLSLLLVACTDDPRPVYGEGAWRFVRNVPVTCVEFDRERVVAGEHGAEGPAGGTITARCAARTLSSGALSINLELYNDQGDGIDIRDLRIPAEAAASNVPVTTVPTQCNSILIDTEAGRYQAVCTTEEPTEGECQFVAATLDPAVSGISLEFTCPMVLNLGSGSVCEIGGAGGESAVILFEECRGL